MIKFPSDKEDAELSHDYNGFGQDEQTLSSCANIDVKYQHYLSLETFIPKNMLPEFFISDPFLTLKDKILSQVICEHRITPHQGKNKNEN